MVMVRKSDTEFEKAPAGVHLARCIRLIDLGTQFNKTFQTKQHKVRVYWELPNCLMTKGEYSGKPFIISKQYTLSLSEKSHLRNDLKSWRGRDFSEQEMAGFDLNSIVDKCCTLNIVHENDYANVAAVIPIAPGTTLPPRINPIIIFDMAHFDSTVFDSLTDNMKETIKASEEWQEIDEKMNFVNNEQQTQGDNQFNDDIPF